MATSHMAPPPHMEGGQQQTSKTWRITRGGRKIWYRLTVLQEPERARACGSGPKSTTDRRPVDPPPVIELRIYEGESIEAGKDITFTYNANFFLFTTLEHARPVANGRVNTAAATTPPVLTGMFVSGMAYLDRPQEAGYFLFPDLSVRHEGRYKLIFNLYEQTKEDKDKDPETARVPPRAPQAPADFNDLDESFDHRLKVESRPFSVFSAKKFPGLTESTTLSRTISEQGCRVRIRRDVRMRRRENKPSTGTDYEAKQKEEYERRQRTQTPDHGDPYRARSLSNSSTDRTPYTADPYQRRPSVTDYHTQAPPPPPAYGPPPHTPTSHLQFGQSNNQYPPPQSHYPPPPPQQQPQSSPLTPKQPQYPPPAQAYPGPSQYHAVPAAPNPLPPLQRAPAEALEPPHHYPMDARGSNDNSRRPSAGYAPPTSEARPTPNYPPSSIETRAPVGYMSHEGRQTSSYPPPPSASQSPVSPNYPPPSGESQASSSHPATPSGESYPPLSELRQRPRQGRGSDASETKLPPISSLIHMNSHASPKPPILPLPSLSNSQGTKRSFDDTFNSDGHYQSLANGARQTDPHHHPPADRRVGYDEPRGMSSRYYSRADGRLEMAGEDRNNTPQLPHAPYNL